MAGYTIKSGEFSAAIISNYTMMCSRLQERTCISNNRSSLGKT